MKAFQEYWPTHGWQLTKQLLERNKPPRWCSTRCQRCWKWFPCYSTFVELPYPDSRVFLGALPLAHSCWQHPGNQRVPIVWCKWVSKAQKWDPKVFLIHRWHTSCIYFIDLSPSSKLPCDKCFFSCLMVQLDVWYGWFSEVSVFFYSSSASKKTGDLPTKNTHWAESFRCSLGFPRV